MNMRDVIIDTYKVVRVNVLPSPTLHLGTPGQDRNAQMGEGVNSHAPLCT
jgi:hypothetical protein